MEYLRRCLDDPAAAPCGRCDNCAGPWITAAVSAEALAAAQAHLGRVGVTVAPRRLWPTGLPAVGVPLSGKIPATEQVGAGRALARLSDLGWGERLRRVLAEGAPDGPLPDDVYQGVVRALADWARGDDPWPSRPVGLVTVGSRRRPALIADLGARIAATGRLPLLGSVSPVGPGGGRTAGNSAQRVRVLHEAFDVPAELADRLAGLDGPVLLVDDQIDSGWTAAIVGRLLRRAGAPAVFPFALALAG
jgi:ATP-dependent DNA helicase RecQ